MPFGFGKGGGRCRGAGRGAARLGRGGRFTTNRSENCICPSCGAITAHQLGVPCFQIKCPSCGSPMTRQFGTAVAPNSQGQISNRRMPPRVDPDLCTGCCRCMEVCPVDVISMINGKAVINEVTCNGCRICVSACPVSAIN